MYVWCHLQYRLIICRTIHTQSTWKAGVQATVLGVQAIVQGVQVTVQCTGQLCQPHLLIQMILVRSITLCMYSIFKCSYDEFNSCQTSILSFIPSVVAIAIMFVFVFIVIKTLCIKKLSMTCTITKIFQCCVYCTSCLNMYICTLIVIFVYVLENGF